jgi:hypothetical protein
VSPECGESGREVGDAWEGEDASGDAERVAKNWGVFSQVYCHDIMRHGDVFRVCAVVTQLTTKNGVPLFEVEYKD